MASKTCSSLALFLTLNLIFFSLVSACGYTPCPGPNPKPRPNPNPNPNPSPSGSCPRDALKLGVCANVLNLVNVTLGQPPVTPCCTLLDGLVDLEAAVCLCTALKANIEKQAEWDRKVEVDAQNVCFESSAKAHCSLKVNETIEKGATRGNWWLTQSGVHQV